MHDTFLALLEETLQAHGLRCTREAALEGRSGTVYTVPILAETDGKAFIIDAHLDDAPLPQAAVQDMADVMHDAGADGGVMCHVGATEAGAADGGVVLWGRDELTRLIGEARLAAATGLECSPVRLREHHRSNGPVAESVDDVLPSAFHEEEPAPSWEYDDVSPAQPTPPDAQGTPAPDEDTEQTDPLAALGGIDLDGLGADPTPTTAEPTSASDDAEARTPPAPTAGTTGGEAGSGGTAEASEHPLLPIRVLPDEARIAVKEKIYHVDVMEMVLRPVHLVDYECDLLAEGSLRYDTISGRVQIDANDKTPSEVDAEAIDPAGFTRLDDVPDLPRHERDVRTTADRAKQITADFLLEAHSRIVDVEVDEEDGGYSYTEKKRVAPRPDHIRLNPVGTFHRVLWRLRGPNGQMDVDALTGEVAEENLRRPNPDAVMLD